MLFGAVSQTLELNDLFIYLFCTGEGFWKTKKKSVKTDRYLENMLSVLIPKQIQPKRKVMEISFNEMQQTVFFF